MRTARYTAPMGRLEHELYTPEQVRALDQRAIEVGGVAGEELMERAGRSAWRVVQRSWPHAQRIRVLCGVGNNAGDGYVVARLAHQAGRDVRVIALRDPGALRGDAGTHARRALEGGVDVVPWGEGGALTLDEADLLVDAVLGTGLNGPPRDEMAAALEAAADTGRDVLALDIPSGLDGRTGEAPGAHLPARRTVTFVAHKVGLWTGRGPALCGPITLEPLGVEAWTDGALVPEARLTDAVAAREGLAPRPADLHKGRAGHVLVVGGDHGMGGAVRLAGEAALRAGAGLVSVATRPAHVAPILAGRPEVMVHGVDDPDDLAPLLERADAVALGPGLGCDAWGRALYAALHARECPMVLDADALNLLAEHPESAAHALAGAPPRVLTPHPGEARRLVDALGVRASLERGGRLALARALSEGFGHTVVLKGSGTVIDDGVHCAINPTGNAGMASAGMGDALTGVTAALLAAGAGAFPAACSAVWWHGAAGDRATAARGPRGIVAGDLIDALPESCP